MPPAAGPTYRIKEFAALFRRIIEVIDMQHHPDDWKARYDALVQAKIERLGSLPPATLASLKKDWTTLMEEAGTLLNEDPAGPAAQRLAHRCVAVMERLMGAPIDPAMLSGPAPGQPLRDERLAKVFPDPRVREFLRQAIAARG